jgi:hypothetical protein
LCVIDFGERFYHYRHSYKGNQALVLVEHCFNFLALLKKFAFHNN